LKRKGSIIGDRENEASILLNINSTMIKVALRTLIYHC